MTESEDSRAAEDPVPEAKIATDPPDRADDIGISDPMASIRPKLLSPLIEATVELSRRSGGPDDSDAAEATLERHEPARRSSDAALETHETHAAGPVIPIVEPGATTIDNAERVAYRLLDRIGAGGMGEVWRALQRELGRPVALKRLRDSRLSPSIIALFKNEARLTAMLDHPNIVTVHELGHDQSGGVFYTMKLIEGTPWSEIISTGRRRTRDGEVVEVELRDHLDILVEVSQAIAFAHSRMIIHRDIKPGNVMVGTYGEVLVVDWGLAVAIEASPGMTTTLLEDLPKSALVCGTPAYMSPETATAERAKIGLATDVYLLGAVLFHVLYGRPPHRGKSVAEVIRKAKVNAWSIPRELPGRLRPWDTLLRPVITQALASDSSQRYANAGEFGDALREAIRNYESAKVASLAQEQLLDMQHHSMSAGESYQRLAALIARLEGALESWPRNLAARQTLAHTRLELARQALANGDLSLARISVEAYLRMPKLPEPEPAVEARRLTLHPVDGTLVGAPRPTDSLIAAGTSNQWISSLAELGARSPSASALAKTIGAAEIANGRAAKSSGPRELGSSPLGMQLSSVASVEIQDSSDEAMLDEDQRFAASAARLGREIAERERLARRRRISVRVAGSVVAALLLAVIGSVAIGQLRVREQKRSAQSDRNKLSELLLDETANTVEAQLDLVFEPVDTALTTALAWARRGDLDSDDPAVLNRFYMPLLASVDAITSTLRADSHGREYMLLERPDGWRTRTTKPDAPRELRDWSATGEQIDLWYDHAPYDPHERPWYIGGAALHGQPGAGVFWTEPYEFFTTREIGISVSAPVTSVNGRMFVLAFDIKLGDLTRATGELLDGVAEGQVFVLGEKLELLALPRELGTLEPAAREQLLLEPLAEFDRQAPVSSAAVRAWQARGDDGPFQLELGPRELGGDAARTFWVRFRQIDRPDRPKMWIGVVVPEWDLPAPD